MDDPAGLMHPSDLIRRRTPVRSAPRWFRLVRGGFQTPVGQLVASGDAANTNTSSIYSVNVPDIGRKPSPHACSHLSPPAFSLLLLLPLLKSTNSQPHSLSLSTNLIQYLSSPRPPACDRCWRACRRTALSPRCVSSAGLLKHQN